MNDWQCPHCKNKTGCTFGTCIECGFNYLDGTFHWVVITKDDLHLLPFNLRCHIIDKHSDVTEDLFSDVYNEDI